MKTSDAMVLIRADMNSNKEQNILQIKNENMFILIYNHLNMKLHVTNYSNIIHALYAVIYLLVNMFLFITIIQCMYFVYASTATCLINAIVPPSFLIYTRIGLKIDE